MVITLSVIIWWILIGLVVGAVARLVIPGRQHIGILVTILIGAASFAALGRSPSRAAPPTWSPRWTRGPRR